MFYTAETLQHERSCNAQAENTALHDIPALYQGSQQSIVSVSVHVRDGCGAPAL